MVLTDLKKERFSRPEAQKCKALSDAPPAVNNGHQAIEGEAAEFCIADTREVGFCNFGAAIRCAHGQALPIRRLDDFSAEHPLELPCTGVLFPAGTTPYPRPPPRTNNP